MQVAELTEQNTILTASDLVKSEKITDLTTRNKNLEYNLECITAQHDQLVQEKDEMSKLLIRRETKITEQEMHLYQVR